MTFRAFLSAVCLLTPVLACGDDPIAAIDRSADCADICTRYKDCISTDYDVEACADRCTDMSKAKQTAKIDSCETCLDGKSCVGSAFQCIDECAGIVP